LAFEAGLGDLNLAYSGLDTLSESQLLNQTLFGNFRCEEVEPLFDYIKTTHHSDRPLIYSGFDNQTSSSFFEETIKPIVSKYNPNLGDELEYALDGFRRWFRAGYYQDSLLYVTEAEGFVATAMEIQAIFNNNKSEILSEFSIKRQDFEFIDQTCKGFIRTVELPYSERRLNVGHRDAIMFDNFQWLVTKVYPNKKVIIWAHNAHIEQRPMFENSFKWMGHFLNETYGEDYYALGLFSQSGTAFQQWGDTVLLIRNGICLAADSCNSLYTFLTKCASKN